MTRYDRLREASERNRLLFEKYEQDSWKFVGRFRKRLVAYLECPGEQVRWMQFSEEQTDEEREEVGVIKLAFGRRMALHNDGTYGFVLRIMLGLRWLDLAFRVKSIGEAFEVKFGEDQREIHKDSEEQLQALVEDVFLRAKKYLDTRFEDFFDEKPRKSLGFSVPEP